MLPHSYRTACAKCLLTGEHSVLFGGSALSLPVPLYTRTKLKVTGNSFYSLRFPQSYGDHRTYSLRSLLRFQSEKEKLYDRFQKGEIAIESVLGQKVDLSLLTLAHLAQELPSYKGFELEIVSDIPVARGLGSSAALISSILRQTPSSLELLAVLSQSLESFQHGLSSGLDTMTSLYQKMIIKQEDKFRIEDFPEGFWEHYCLVDTGLPTSSTGQCVSHTKEVFKKSPKLLSEFCDVSDKMIASLSSKDYVSLNSLIEKNHQLLERAGVVPSKVSDFASTLRSNNIAAKICGAGSISGDNGGLMIVAASSDFIRETIESYGYKVIFQSSKVHHANRTS